MRISNGFSHADQPINNLVICIGIIFMYKYIYIYICMYIVAYSVIIRMWKCYESAPNFRPLRLCGTW